MKHQEMNVLLGGESIEYSTNGMVEMKAFTAQGNAIRLKKGLSVYNAAKYLDGADMNDFIGALVRRYGGEKRDYIRVEGKGSKARTLADIRIAVKLAMKMDSDFELMVIDTFVGLAEWRLKGGDEFKALNAAIDRYLPGREGKSSNKGCYLNAAKMIRARCGVEKKGTDATWNQASANKVAQALRYDIEHKLVGLLELGLVRDWDHLKELIDKV